MYYNNNRTNRRYKPQLVLAPRFGTIFLVMVDEVGHACTVNLAMHIQSVSMLISSLMVSMDQTHCNKSYY